MTQRTWLITGVNSGFGRHITEQLLAHGNGRSHRTAAPTWLCSDAASYITGILLSVNGGMTLT